MHHGNNDLFNRIDEEQSVLVQKSGGDTQPNGNPSSTT